MDVVDGRVLPVIDVGMSPALMWDESVVSGDGAALACTLCGWANLHLDMIHFAMPVDMYEPPRASGAVGLVTGRSGPSRRSPDRRRWATSAKASAVAGNEPGEAMIN